MGRERENAEREHAQPWCAGVRVCGCVLNNFSFLVFIIKKKYTLFESLCFFSSFFFLLFSFFLYFHVCPHYHTPIPTHSHTMANANANENSYNSLLSAAKDPHTAAVVRAGTAARMLDIIRGQFCDTLNRFSDEIPHLPEHVCGSIALNSGLTDMHRRFKIIGDVTAARIRDAGDDAARKGTICEDAGEKMTELFCRLKTLMEKTASNAPEDQKTSMHVKRIRTLIEQCVTTWR